MKLNHKSIFLAAGLLVSAVFPAKGQSLKFPDYELNDSYESETILLQLTGLDSIRDRSKIEISKKGVRFNKQSDLRLFNAFRVDPQLMDTSVRVIVDNRETRLQGDYELLVDVFDGKKHTPLVAKFTHQPAVLKELTTLTITRQDPLLGDPSNIESSPLTLQETSGRSRVQATLSEIPYKLVGPDRKFSGIRFEPSVINLEPGKKITIDYRTEGDFPLGLTTVVSEITAPQLSTAKPLSVVVITRRPLYYIVVMLVLGIVLSILLKTVITGLITINDLKIKLIDLISLLRKEQPEHRDKDFNTKSDKIISELTVAAQTKVTFPMLMSTEKEKSRLENLLTTKTSEYEAAKKDLEDRRKAEKKNYEDLLAVPVPLPASLLAVTQSVLFSEKEKIEGYFKEDNITELHDLLAKIKNQFSSAMSKEIEVWKNQIADLQTLLSNHLKPYYATAAELNNKLAPLDTTSLPMPVKVDEIKAAIPLINAIHVEAVETVRSYTQQLLAALNNAAPNLELYYKQPAKLDNLRSSISAYVNSIRSVSPEGVENVIVLSYPPMVNAWKAMILQAPLPLPNPSTERLLLEHRFEAAVTAAIGVIGPLLHEAPVMGAGAATFQRLVIPQTNWNYNHFRNSIVTLPKNLTFRQLIDLTQSNLENRTVMIKAFRFFVVAILLIMIGYFIHDDGFVGKPKELFGIFLWAFTFDLSINTSFDYITDKLQKPKPAFR